MISADGTGSLTMSESAGSIDLAGSYTVNSTGELTITPDETQISTMHGGFQQTAGFLPQQIQKVQTTASCLPSA